MAPARKKPRVRKLERARRVAPAETTASAAALKRKPTAFSPTLAEELCFRMANGETGSSIVREAHMPTWDTVVKWVQTREEFAAQYRKARELQFQFWADEIVDIANDGSNDYVVTAQGKRAFNREGFERSRLRIDTKKWLLSKVARHTYGDRTEHALSTPDGPVGIALQERNALIDAICKLVEPKPDGVTRPASAKEEGRER